MYLVDRNSESQFSTCSTSNSFPSRGDEIVCACLGEGWGEVGDCYYQNDWNLNVESESS